jgi:hypothetical protein
MGMHAALNLQDGIVQTNVEEEYGVSKTIFADCFSLWSRG